MEQIKTDVLVIGAGSGGLSVAAGAVQMGASVVLLEGHEMGGDCLNVGCVPSKTSSRSRREPKSFIDMKRIMQNAYSVCSMAPMKLRCHYRRFGSET